MLRLRFIVAAGIFSIVLVSIANADGIMLPDKRAWLKMQEKALINEHEQKAVIYFNRGEETLIISPRYEGSAENFAWVVPVPSRPNVEIGDLAIFRELDRLLFGLSANKKSVESSVEVLEEKTVGDYDVSVLKSEDGSDLMSWLNSNGYHLPEKTSGIITEYIKKGWKFVACKVHNSQGLYSGTLAPLKLKFLAQEPVYPLKISAVNPTSFSITCYLLIHASTKTETMKKAELLGPPDIADPYHGYPISSVEAGQTDYPALAKISRAYLELFLIECRVDPNSCTSDMIWEISTCSPAPPLPSTERH